jgi:hypothetical protein
MHCPQGRHRAEDLNERIMVWSVFVTFAIFCVGFGQVTGYLVKFRRKTLNGCPEWQ